jgi:protein CpxP
MKRLMTSVLLSATLLTGATAYAGPGPGYGHGAGKGQVHFLAKKLDLTDEQKAAIEEIHRSYGKQDEHGKTGKKHDKRAFKHGFANLDPTSADYSERVAEIARERAARVEQSIIKRGEIHAKVYEVLTPEQREKLASLKENRKKHGGKGSKGERATR